MLQNNIVSVMTVIVMGILMVVASISYADYTLENITAMWLFDDGEGTIATDSSQNDNDGTIHGAQWVDGRFGKALEFNGTDNWVEVSHSDSVVFEAGTSFTLTLHFKGTSVGGSLAGKNYEDTSQSTPWYMLWNGGADGKIAFFLRDGSNASFRMNSTTDINDDQWHFIAGRADAETGKATLWIDGTQEAEYDFNADSGYGTSEGVFHIGRHFNRYSAGIIDEVALFNVALSEDDMQSIMNDGLVNLTAVEATGKLATTWGNVKKRTIE